MPPRVALRRLWLVYRLANLGWGLAWLGASMSGYALGETDGVFASTTVLTAVSLAIAAGFSSSNRARAHEWLGETGQTDRKSAAAVVAAVLGGLPAKEALDRAHEHFLGIDFADLTYEDFASNNNQGNTTARSADLRSRTQRCKLGSVDVFLSHSWHDLPQNKWRKLQAWAAQFKERNNRTPVLWLDKACIDQTAIADSLACLPVFLAGCKNLLVVAGPTYTERLWCVMEIFTFLYMGGALEQIIFLPMTNVESEASRASEKDSVTRKTALKRAVGSTLKDPDLAATRAAFASFDANGAKCFKAEDKDHLLGVIESGMGSIAAFNKSVRHTFSQLSVTKLPVKSASSRESNNRGPVSVMSAVQAVTPQLMLWSRRSKSVIAPDDAAPASAPVQMDPER